ncbi:NifB/NifX family molybdenum-iron cluster-binding protein [Mycoplasmatota bacterium]|nr:NifB/NifX family molybdenum-iron cluster-binding protein [Mycoplasmatota bacterium]
MKVALVFQNNQISQQFGHSEGFKIYNLDENKQILSTKTIMNSGIKGGEIAHLLSSYEVDIIIVGGIGENAKSNLEAQNIDVILGAFGEVSKVIDDYCHNSLQLKKDMLHKKRCCQ